MGILLKADFARRVTLEGVGPVPRPVDVDAAQTGFKALRTLRIYQFDTGAAVEGHAEEDEVFMVALTGAADLVLKSDRWSESAMHHNLEAPTDGVDVACAAYLPPHAEYVLTPRTACDIAYIRATPGVGRPPAILRSVFVADETGSHGLIDATGVAERLSMRLVQVKSAAGSAELNLRGAAEMQQESFVHLRTHPATGAAHIAVGAIAPQTLESWDTMALPSGETARLHVAAGASVLCLIVAAR